MQLNTYRSFIVQLGGALMTLSTNPTSMQNGLHIYTAGVCLQEVVILLFISLGVLFFRRLAAMPDAENLKGAKKLMIILYISLTLITVSSTLYPAKYLYKIWPWSNSD
jgi:hypothetical protein